MNRVAAIKQHPQQIHMDGSTRQQMLYDNAIRLLRDTCPPEGFYVATSFGKDSIVAHRLCDEAGVTYDAHTNVTGIDPPELIHYGRKHYPDVVREHPGTSMWKLIEKKGMPPMRHMRFCCDALKEDGGAGRSCVMGLRAAESYRRAKQWAPLTQRSKGNIHDRKRLFDPEDIRQQVQSCHARGKWTVSPLYYWNDADIWAFIHDRKLPYCELYDQGFDRLGCIGCPMASRIMREYEFERWPKFRAAYVRSFDKLVQAGRFRNKGFSSGEDIMRWWLCDRVQERAIDGQIDISEALYDDLDSAQIVNHCS